MKIMICGAGFVGLTTAAHAAADQAHEVLLAEPDAYRRRSIESGKSPFYEPDLDATLADAIGSGRLTTLSHLTDAPPVDLIVVCVGTPRTTDGHADLAQVESVGHEIGEAIGHWTSSAGTATLPTVVMKSTVPPGTTRGVFKDQIAAAAGRSLVPELTMSPEFLREGHALEDVRHPDRIVIGATTREAAHMARRLYGDTDCPTAYATVETAEAIKYVTNAFLATKVSFANEIGNLCEKIGLDVDDVLQTVALDHRIAPSFLDAGLGFGGSCFPKDLRALQATAREHDVDLSLVEAALARNDRQPLQALEKARREFDDLRGVRVALLGLAFKPHTSDIRESPALRIYGAFREAGADIVCYDPEASAEFAAHWDEEVEVTDSALSALDGADFAIIQTAWPEFRDLDPEDVVHRMRTPVVYDGRRALDAEAYVAAGCRYHALGRSLATLQGQGRRERRMLRSEGPAPPPEHPSSGHAAGAQAGTDRGRPNQGQVVP